MPEAYQIMNVQSNKILKNMHICETICIKSQHATAIFVFTDASVIPISLSHPPLVTPNSLREIITWRHHCLCLLSFKFVFVGSAQVLLYNSTLSPVFMLRGSIMFNFKINANTTMIRREERQLLYKHSGCLVH